LLTICCQKTKVFAWTETRQESLELLLDTHFPKNTKSVEDPLIEGNLDGQGITYTSSTERIKWAINTFKPFKSPGSPTSTDAKHNAPLAEGPYSQLSRTKPHTLQQANTYSPIHPLKVDSKCPKYFYSLGCIRYTV